MSFNIGLSGIRAAASDLNITGNNIANAGTVGFKGSRAEFSDVYAASVLGSGSNAMGSGVVLGDVAQLFNQGAVNFTENSLDLAINGNGFFVTSKNGAMSYTRAGYFGTDSSGFIVNNFGEKLQGFGVNAVTGQINQGVQTDLRVDTRSADPKATTTVASTLNLNSTNVRVSGVQTAYQVRYDEYIKERAAEFVPTDPTDTNDVYRPTALHLREANAAGNLVTAAAAQDNFDPTDSSTYNSSTSVNVFDSQGNPHVLTKYFVKTNSNEWDMYTLIDGRQVKDNLLPTDPGFRPDPYKLSFSTTGQLEKVTSPDGLELPGTRPFEVSGWTPLDKAGQPTGAQVNTSFTINLAGTSQYASSFAVTSVVQDGFTTGELAGLQIDDQGMLVARYTNGQTKVQGQLALATFANQQGLTPIGKTAWAQSSASGEPVIGMPGTGTLGSVQSGALEMSNVDLSEQLINLIIAQRNYQANAKTIQTEDAVTQTIINLR